MLQRDDPQTAAPSVVAFVRVDVTSNSNGGQTRHVIARCPFCGQQHAHRWPTGVVEPGERTAHCGGGRYWLGTSR